MTEDFNNMTKIELRAYLVNHPNNQSAFYAFVDRFTSDASEKLFAMPRSQTEISEIEQLIKSKLQSD
jgi:hypothetical protein